VLPADRLATGVEETAGVELAAGVALTAGLVLAAGLALASGVWEGAGVALAPQWAVREKSPSLHTSSTGPNVMKRTGPVPPFPLSATRRLLLLSDGSRSAINTILSEPSPVQEESSITSWIMADRSADFCRISDWPMAVQSRGDH